MRALPEESEHPLSIGFCLYLLSMNFACCRLTKFDQCQLVLPCKLLLLAAKSLRTNQENRVMKL
jgi:hypothetical protein